MPVWLMLGLARSAVLLFSFARIAKYLGEPVSADAQDAAGGILSPKQVARVKQISRLVTNTARYCPWKANCFAQAIVARILLGWFGLPYRLYFGLQRKNANLGAHAWVCSDTLFVTGGNGFTHFTVVGCYANLSVNAAVKAEQ